MAPYPSDSVFLFDSLYCAEQDWEDETTEVAFDDLNINQKPKVLWEQDLFWEEDELISLLSKEHPNRLYKNLLDDPCLAGARRNAVEWMLKVTTHHCFSALTAVLSVDYLDRFLCGFHFQKENPWMIQLAAVACISLAAKVEETDVPLFLDLQVDESSYLFEAKMINKMEILVLSSLQWRMKPVTAVSFLDFITRKLGLRDCLCFEFLRRSEQILLSLITDSRFMSFLPSVLANAIVLHLVNNIEPSLAIDYHDQLYGILQIDKDRVEDCYRLLSEETGSHGHRSHKRKFGSLPSSPSGVIELHFSSDVSNDSWPVTSSKKTKAIHEQLMETLKTHKNAADLLGITR